MYPEIRAKDFTLTDGIRMHVERRLSFALDRFARRVRGVLVWVGDFNGPKHGADDKFCRRAVHLTKRRVVVAERAADLYVAINRAAHKVSKRIAREVKRGYRPAAHRIRVESPMR